MNDHGTTEPWEDNALAWKIIAARNSGHESGDKWETIPPPATSKIHQRKSITLPSSLCKPSLRTYFNWDDRGNGDYAKRPALLDLFAGGGGAAMGYYLAGFRVIGVDNRSQPRYPFTFVLGDALEYVRKYGAEFDAIHASPPCQAYSMAGNQWRQAGKQYDDLVALTRDALKSTGVPYIIENVPGAPLINPTVLNGEFFSMRVRRTRWFETSIPVPFVLLPPEQKSYLRMGRPVREGDIITPVGHFSNVPYARREMGIDWMTQAELAQAIPPAYTEYIGRILLKELA